MATLPMQLLVYCSLLRKGQYKQLRDLAVLHHGAVDISRVDQAMRAGIDKRLALAREFLLFADGLATDGTSDIAARNAVSRAYYAMHHAIRALLLFEERGDVDGHWEAIEAIGGLIKRNPAVRSKLDPQGTFRRDARELMERRHLADYYPYGVSAPAEPPADFTALAVDAVRLAQQTVEKTEEYITQKEAGTI